jgi:hypothetical protein
MKSIKTFILLSTLVFSLSSMAELSVQGGIKDGGFDSGGAGGTVGGGGGTVGGGGGTVGGVGVGVGVGVGTEGVLAPIGEAKYSLTDIKIINGKCSVKGGPTGDFNGSPCQKMYGTNSATAGGTSGSSSTSTGENNNQK